MESPLFPLNTQKIEMPTGILTLEPYRRDDAWVFDDNNAGLVAEPFVSGISEMIDRLTATIPAAAEGFRLLFAIHPFEGHQTSLTWLRSDPVEGNWYRADDLGDEGWLCPALFCYFPVPPPKIFVRAEPK